MFGQSTRKCGYPSPVRRGTSPVSIASRLTSPNARSGTARTPLQFYLLDPSRFSQRRTASTTRRSQRSRFAGSRLIQNISAPLPCVAVTPKRFMLRPYRRFHPLPRRASPGLSTQCYEQFHAFEVRVIGNPNLQPEVAYEWSYGAVYSPKWIKGLTLTADWWHIDMRSITSLLGVQFIVDNDIPGLVIRGPPSDSWSDRDQSSWSSIPTKILQARFLKVSTTKRSIFWSLRCLATGILAD